MSFRPRRSCIAAFDPNLRAIDLIVIGCSAGGVQALKQILSALPVNFRPAMAVVLHVHAESNGTLAGFFQQMCKRPVKEAEDKEVIASGTVYFAPANYHLQIEPGRTFSLSIDPPICFSRPSIDVLFETAAPVYGRSLAAMILTGASEDGAAGFRRAKHCGALTIVQDPESAEQPAMPLAAIHAAPPDRVLSLSQMEGLVHEFI